MATPPPSSPSPLKNIVFFHPDLGIGGAERLVIDAAVGLQDLGHKVTIFTSYRDKNHCFDEAKDGTLDVRVRGDNVIPPSFNGRFSILCAILRQLHLVLQICLFTHELVDLKPTIFFVDQLSAGIPLLRAYFADTRVLFYCHFPDKLLAQKGGLLKSLYRVPFDWLESWTTGASDAIVVNSRFTRGIFAKAFPGLKYRNPGVVYPCVDVEESYTGSKEAIWPARKIFLSINRFERKKDIGLAIKAFAGLSEQTKKHARLVIAGGYDKRVPENVAYHNELVTLATSLNLTHSTATTTQDALSTPPSISVLFILSVPSALKARLLHTSTLLLYTPSFEHFGIVPLEAMLARTPVLAASTGGPTETVVNAETGWLRPVEDVARWTDVMEKVLSSLSQRDLQDIGEAGHRRVVELFSKRKMAERLVEAMDGAQEASEAKRPGILPVSGVLLYNVFGLMVGVALALLYLGQKG